MTPQDVRRIVAPLWRRVVGTVARAIARSVDDSGNLQTHQVEILKDELRDKVDSIAHYGFTSVPKPGAEAVVVFVGGSRDHPLVIATEDARYRLKSLKSGEVALYTDEGDYVELKRGKIVKIRAQTKLEIETPEVTISGKLTVTGIVKGSEVQNAVGTKLGTHVHASNGAPPTPGT